MRQDFEQDFLPKTKFGPVGRKHILTSGPVQSGPDRTGPDHGPGPDRTGDIYIPALGNRLYLPSNRKLKPEYKYKDVNPKIYLSLH